MPEHKLFGEEGQVGGEGRSVPICTSLGNSSKIGSGGGGGGGRVPIQLTVARFDRPRGYGGGQTKCGSPLSGGGGGNGTSIPLWPPAIKTCS